LNSVHVNKKTIGKVENLKFNFDFF